MATIPTREEFLSWIERDITRYGRIETVVEFKTHAIGDGHTFEISFNIYTDVHKFHIVAHREKTKSYLGCTAACRKPRAGEERHRGNDLVDGQLTAETWHRILADIVSYELVKVHRPKAAVPDESPDTVHTVPAVL